MPLIEFLFSTQQKYMMPLIEFLFSTHIPNEIVWCGMFSKCLVKGSIIKFMKHVVEGLSVNKKLVVPSSDGFMNISNYRFYIKNIDDLNNVSTDEDIVGILCSRNLTDKRLLYMPLDDESFEKGVVGHMTEHIHKIKWEEKSPVAYWRGAPTGGLFPTIRSRVVLAASNNTNIDAKFIRDVIYVDRDQVGMLIDTYQEDKYWTSRVPAQSHINYKYILIVDGNCIASSYQWVFASGSVPVMITHPNNEFWFKRYLKPMETFVPIDYSLCDLEEKIQWLCDNDDKAKQIATNALEFARTILSSEFQKMHLKWEIERIGGI
jgi:hypothetical protein